MKAPANELPGPSYFKRHKTSPWPEGERPMKPCPHCEKPNGIRLPPKRKRPKRRNGEYLLEAGSLPYRRCRHCNKIAWEWDVKIGNFIPCFKTDPSGP